MIGLRALPADFSASRPLIGLTFVVLPVAWILGLALSALRFS